MYHLPDKQTQTNPAIPAQFSWPTPPLLSHTPLPSARCFQDTSHATIMPDQRRRLMLSAITVVAAAGLLPRSAAFLHAPTATASWKRSSSLQASTTTGTRTVPAGAGSIDAPDDQPVEPTGTHHPWYSLAPLKEAGRWAARDGEYFNELTRANGGATVFKGHPGLAVTFLTDIVSCEWFFSQPPSVLDRQVRRKSRRRQTCKVCRIFFFFWVS